MQQAQGGQTSWRCREEIAAVGQAVQGQALNWWLNKLKAKQQATRLVRGIDVRRYMISARRVIKDVRPAKALFINDLAFDALIYEEMAGPWHAIDNFFVKQIRSRNVRDRSCANVD